MLKWTLRTPADTCSCPPSPPLKSSVRSQPDLKVDLEDSNKCWYEARVKVAEVKSTSKVVQFNTKENVKYEYTENDEELGRANNNIFNKSIPFPTTADEIEKRKSVHKYVKCNALDPLNIFTGYTTDSDTGSVYMKLDKTPAALLPKEMPLTSSGPFDPRRRPLIDISNGDYSDLRKHLQLHNVSLSTLLHSADIPPPPPRYQDEGPNNCSQQFIPGNVLTFYEQLRNFQRRSEKFSQVDKVPTKAASGDQGNDLASSSRPRSSVPRTRNFETTAHFTNNSCTLTTTSVTTTTSCPSTTSVSLSTEPSSKLSCLAAQSNRHFKEKKEEAKMTKNGKFPVSRSRHSIADIRCVSQRSDHNHFESERTTRNRKSPKTSHVKDSSHSFFAKTDEKKKELNENQKRSSGKRLGIYHKIFDAKVCGRKKVKQEPIYESIRTPKGTEPVATSTAGLQDTPNREIYISMKDLRAAENNNAHETGAKEDDYEICVFSSPPKEFQDKKRAPIQLSDFPVYENALYLSSEEKNVKPSLPNSFIPDDSEKGDTCDFTSEPQKNVHKPVAIKGSNDLITRFGKSASDRQHPMPQFGLHISSDPVKKPCKWRYIHESDNSRCKLNDSCLNRKNKYYDSIGGMEQISIPQSNICSQRYYENLDFLEAELNHRHFTKSKSESYIYKPPHLHTSTGQHLHTTTMSAINLPGLPLHNLRPPPPHSPNTSLIKSGPQNHFSNKIKKKSKPFLRLDANLPVIYEVHSQEEEINSSGLKIDRKDEIQKNIYRGLEEKNDDFNISGSSPDSESNKSHTSDNLDSGLSEGINTPLISPMSAPPSPNSDSLLGEPQAALSLEDLKIYKENEAYTKENKFFSGTYIDDILTCEYINKLYEHNNGSKETNYDSFNITNIHRNHSTPIKSDELLNKESPFKENGCAVDLSKLVRTTIEKNLFAPSTPAASPISNSSFKSSHSCSINRRHSFASIKDISKTGSNRMDFCNQASTADTIFHNPPYSNSSTPCVLKKSHSFMSLSPATKTIFVPANKGVTEDSGNTSDKDSFLADERELEGGCVLSPGGKDGSGKAEMKDRPIKEPGRTASGQGCSGREGISPSYVGKTRKGRGDGLVWRAREDQNGDSGGFAGKWTSNSSPDHHNTEANESLASVRKDSSNSCISRRHLGFPPFTTSSSSSGSSFDLPSFLPSGNLTLPGEMKKEAQMSRKRHITGHSVPPLQPLSKDALIALEKLPSFIASQELVQHNDLFLTERQRLRHAESLFRLQRLLDEPPSHRDSDEGDAESSADWSLEAVIDEASLNGFDSPFRSPESSRSGSELDSQDCQDSFSICTLDSDLADSVYIGPKLCDKIRQVSEDKMLSKLRRSFRKKDKRVPKVGIFMLVDNPMYVSPEAKKEAKIVSFTPSKRKSFRFKIKSDKGSEKTDEVFEPMTLNKNTFWYVGNPTYNSPGDFGKSKNKSFHTIECEKENIKNYQVSKSISNSSPRPRLPLRDLWIQTNPCYESPNIKTTISPSKRKKDSPKREKYKKPLPDPPIQPPPVRTNESHYLTPILSKKHPLPVRHDNSILDIQKYIDHEYCTIAGDEESDSWISRSSSSSRRSDSSPSAKRNLNFEKGQERTSPKQPLEATKTNTPKGSSKRSASKAAAGSRVKASNTPSRIWREDSNMNQQLASKNYYRGTLEKSLENQMPFGDRGYKTPRSVKREKMNRNFSKSRVPPDLPCIPAPLPPNFSGRHPFDDTNAFHHAALDEGIGSSAETSSVFQLAPDSIYESISFLHVDRSPGLTSPSQMPHPRKSSGGGTTSGICSSCSSNSSSACSCNSFSSPSKSQNKIRIPSKGEQGDSTLAQGSSLNSVVASSSSGISSSYSRSTPDSVVVRKRKARGCRLNVSKRSAGRPSPSFNVSSHSLGGGRGRRTPRKMISKKYKAREVLQGKGQLRIAVYENCGLLTIHIIEARKLRPHFSTVCNPYVKISLVPDDLERTFCRTTLLRATNAPFFDQKFSFDFLPEDFDKRLLISLWNRDTLRKRSEFLGCMSFSVIHILSKRVSGWFRLLTEAVGRRKHFAVSFLTGSVDNSRYDEREALQPVSLPNKPLGPKYPACTRMTSSAGNSPPLGQTPYTISVNIQRTNEGFGFSVAWTRPPRIERVEPGKAADVSGLKTGDYIIFVGNQNVVKLDENSVLNIIRDSGEQLALEVYRRGVSKTPKTMLNGWARPPPLSTSDPTSSITTHDTFRKNKIGHGILGNEVGGVLI